ncbi:MULTISPECIES: MFS transporter [unclassified Exiguobacterium]|uniref:MFS transporter n=1 Tax=unclassified Exiguobacterium TaxID=2644629 RepID=UPI001BE5E237|nr:MULTISPECIES: MFS transporter [unclassified Exiguobacterium]
MKKIMTQYKGLPREAYVLIIGEFINSTGNFVIPFLTFILTLSLGIEPSEAGIWITIVTILYIPGSLIGGKLADSNSRKAVIIAVLALKALIFVICAFIGFDKLLIFLLMLSMFLGAVASPSLRSLLADVSTRENRQAVYSLMYLSINLAMSISPLIAGLLYQKYPHYLFIGDAATLVIAITLYLLFIPNKPKLRAAPISNDSKDKVEGSVYSFLSKNTAILFMLTCMYLYYVIYSQHSFSLPIHLNTFHENGPALFGMLMAINGFTVVLLTSVITYFTKNNSSSKNMGLSGALLGIGFGMIFIADSVTMLVISTVTWTIGEILTSTNSEVFIANNTKSQFRGRVFGLFSVIKSAGLTTGPLLGGFYIGLFNVKLIWPVVFCVSIVYCLLVYFAHMKNKKMSEQNSELRSEVNG